MIFRRPAVTIAILYAILIILLRPIIPVPEKTFNNDKQEIPIISALSNRFISIITQTTPDNYGPLLGSIVFGSSVSPLDPELKEKYKKVGLAHLLVASGTQVSILIGVCLAISRYLKIPIGWSVLLTSIINILFTIMAGCGVSMIRASMMGEIVLVGKLFNRDAEIYTSLALSALILMVINPLVIFDLGFQLSFAATWALVYLCPIFEEKGIPSIVAVSLAPILATIPITLYNFNQFSVVSLLVNVLVVPWVELLTVAGFASTVLGSIFSHIAHILNVSLYLILKIVNGIVYTFSSLPIACIYFKQPWFPFIVLYYGSLVYFVEYLKGKRLFKLNKQNFIIIALLFLTLCVWNAALSQDTSFGKDNLQISVIDVGQGDSIFIKAPSGKTMLIDAGPKFRRSDAGKKIVLPFLRRQGVNKLDVVVLTHPHDDHVGGMPSVLQEMPIGLVLDSGQAHTSKAYIKFLSIIDEKKIPYKLGRAEQGLDLGGNVRCQILNPTEPFIEKSALNNNSVVILLTYKNFRALFMGDAEKEAEERIFFQPVTFLKVGHHGSNTASSQEFLDAIKPKVAIISDGKNNVYHHPHPSTLKKLQKMGIQAYRTDLDGTVTVNTDGVEYHIKQEVKNK